MKRFFAIVAFFVCAVACTNEQQHRSGSDPAGSQGTDTGSRGDTASYERMPQQTNDSTRK